MQFLCTNCSFIEMCSSFFLYLIIFLHIAYIHAILYEFIITQWQVKLFLIFRYENLQQEICRLSIIVINHGPKNKFLSVKTTSFISWIKWIINTKIFKAYL